MQDSEHAGSGGSAQAASAAMPSTTTERCPREEPHVPHTVRKGDGWRVRCPGQASEPYSGTVRSHGDSYTTRRPADALVGRRWPNPERSRMHPAYYRSVYADLDIISELIARHGTDTEANALGRVLGLLAVSDEDKEALAHDLGMAL
jgi:hypothetical protein